MMSALPRNFKLLDELEDAEKSAKGGADISLGLTNADDTYMSDWQASIFCPAGGGEHRIWFLSLHAGPKYPMEPPTIKFSSRISLDCVDDNGNVINSRVPYLASWNHSKSLYGALTELKRLITTGPRRQPPEGATY